MRADGSLEIIDDIDSKLDSEWARLISLNGVTYKHLLGQHDQKKHGYRYGRAPSLSQARSLVAAGLWEDYLERARAAAGKGTRLLPTKEEFESAQKKIIDERLKYAKYVQGIESISQRMRDNAQKNKIVADANELYSLRHREYMLKLEEIDKVRENTFNESKRLSNSLIEQMRAAADAHKFDLYDRLQKKLDKNDDERSRFMASINGQDSYYSILKGDRVPVKPHKLIKELNAAEKIMEKAERAYKATLKKIKRENISDLLEESARIIDGMEAAGKEYVKATEGARRVAMAYLRDEAMKLRKEVLAMNRKGGATSLKKIEERLSAQKELVKKEKADYIARGEPYHAFLLPSYQVLASLESAAARLRGGNISSKEALYYLMDKVSFDDQKHSRLKTDVETPVLDKTSQGWQTVESILSDRENSLYKASGLIGKNSVIEAHTISVRNARGDDGRAYASMGNIFLFSHSRGSSIAHELGHTLEHIEPAFRAEIKRFLNRRTRGESPQKLKDAYDDKTYGASYGSEEVTIKDRFIDPYIGKSYKDASEVLSMGLQYFYDGNIGRLMNLDPDMFAQIYAVLRLGAE